MDWIHVIGIISLFVIVFIPIFWIIHHFRDPIPDSKLRTPWESVKLKTEFEKIFGM